MKQLMTPKTVAEILQVSENTAQEIIADLPHVDVSGNGAARKRLRITEEVLNGYINGTIQRVSHKSYTRENKSKRKSTRVPQLIAYRRA